MGGGLMVVGSVPTDNGPAGGSSATLDDTTILGNFAIGGHGATEETATGAGSTSPWVRS